MEIAESQNKSGGQHKQVYALCGVAICLTLCGAIYAILPDDPARHVSRNTVLLEAFKFLTSTVLVAIVGFVYTEIRAKQQSAEESQREKARQDKARDEVKFKQEAEANEAKRERAAEENSRKLLEKRLKSEKETEQRQVRRRRLEEFMNDFTTRYNKVKYYRRELRRNLFKTDDGNQKIDNTKYVEIMKEINLTQLYFEQFRRVCESNPDYLSKISEVGRAELRVAEEYLRRIVGEYEKKKLEFLKGGEGLAVPVESELFQFVVPSDDRANNKGVCLNEFFNPLDRFFTHIYNQIDVDQ